MNIFKKLFYLIKYKDVSFVDYEGYDGMFCNRRRGIREMIRTIQKYRTVENGS